MRFEFNQGVPQGCTEWLWNNVGPGNIGRGQGVRNYTQDGDQWFYERVSIPVPLGDAEPHHVPTITIKDEKLAVLFILRWT